MLCEWLSANGGAVDALAFRQVLLNVWMMPAHPESLLPLLDWVNLFRQAAFPRPSEPVQLFRGALPSRRRGMAWTADPERAHWFAHRWEGNRGQHARVYSLTAPPDAVLCDVDGWSADVGFLVGFADESELVLDPFRMGRPVRVDVPANPFALNQ
jgi:hypothetical protein